MGASGGDVSLLRMNVTETWRGRFLKCVSLCDETRGRNNDSEIRESGTVCTLVCLQLYMVNTEQEKV